MKRLYIGSMERFSGKSLFCLGISFVLKEMGLKTGYIKPIGREPVQYRGKTVDADALFFKDLLSLEEPPEVLSPFVASLDALNRTLSGRIRGVNKRIIKAIKSITGVDILLIAGTTNIFEGSVYGINGLNITEATGAKALLVESWRQEETIDGVFAARQIMGESFLGVVFNRVRVEEMDFVKRRVGPYLKRHGIEVLGTIPYDRVLGSVTVKKLVEILGGRVLCAEDHVNELVENFSIGAMDVTNALRYFRKTPNKAVITGAHRSDIQIAALETSTKCVILTGGLLPNDIIIGKAKLKGIPLISVKDDTFTIIDRIERVMGKFRIREKGKIEQAVRVVRDNVDVKRILNGF